MSVLSSELGPRRPLSSKRVPPPPPPEPKGGDTKGGSQFRRLEKKLSTLSTLCYTPSTTERHTQGVTKRCRLSWLTNSALVGGLRGLSQ